MQNLKLYYRMLAVCFIVLLVFVGGCYQPAPIPVRDVLFRSQEAPDGFGAYGYLILIKRSSDNNVERYEAVCNAFFYNLEHVSEYPEHNRSSLMPTYWLAKDSTRFDKKSMDCQQWISEYDYARAKEIASSIKLLDIKGPVLVAWSKPFEKVNDQEEALVLNLSGFSNEDMDRAFGIWMDRITRNPDVWQAGFDLVLIKESFRNFLEKYGEHIIDAIKTVKDIF
jgi:hypothetical protein